MGKKTTLGSRFAFGESYTGSPRDTEIWAEIPKQQGIHMSTHLCFDIFL